MPNRDIHVSATVGLSVASLAVLAFDEQVGAALFFGCLLGLFIHPDLDLDNGKFSLWRWLWYPYSKLIPHRSWVSHSPVISTIIRLLYLAPIGLAVASQVHIPKLPYGWMFLGLVLSDVIHIVLDHTLSAWKDAK